MYEGDGEEPERPEGIGDRVDGACGGDAERFEKTDKDARRGKSAENGEYCFGLKQGAGDDDRPGGSEEITEPLTDAPAQPTVE